MTMTPGGNAPVPSQLLTVRVLSGVAVDASSFRLYASGKVQGDPDMVFYGQPVNDDASVKLSGAGTDTAFTVDLNRLRPEVQKLAFTATCDGNMTLSGLKHLSIQVELNGNVLLTGNVDVSGRQEAALILGEFYRRNAEWKFRFIAQGFNGGLKPLAEHFGVDISDSPAPASPPAPAPKPTPEPAKISLSKVSLTKEKPSISLAKRDNFGEIKINLNWNQDRGASGGMFGGMFNKSKGIDLDLGAFVELQDGSKGVVQALGNTFGRLNSEPFVELQGDDRTGQVTDGEWLHVNGREWKKIRQVLIYAFIYEGVASWDKTDGVVTLHIPEQPPIETRLTEGSNRHNMCAIARLVNENGTIKVERINQFFSGHKDMDKALGWGFRWSAGSK
ncbi:TerD family protein [Rouxiella silvae]|uniref:TerD family protein n=2 Tax=Yersiniaceae TaxID=1903411 RepID=A0AA40X649_9GAMM|nr:MULTISPECIES: TerD family protein [Yersiniaceae]MBF6639159.1 TerD family protein [Rouxiella silvae]MBU9824007.1 TerD family protein [Rahnella perminowiae]MBU9833744.1 TerD family protein [Rahnella perminowiae]MCC3721299.1 TerD family protein [Rouxiella badensis]MCC3729448.1 TerD family protein [Rouxiella badensis]